MPSGKTLVLILAGGEGGRLDVLTEHRAKPAMPFAGVYRLIDFSLSNCVHSHLSDVWVVEQYQPHSLNEHLANGRPWDLDRTYGGLQVLPPYINRKDGPGEGGFARGNADAIYRNRHFIREFNPEWLLVLSADQVYRMDYREILEAHGNSGREVTMAVTQIDHESPSRYGVVEFDKDDRVMAFQYKPEKPTSRWVTTEVFVYTWRALLQALEDLAEEAQREMPDGEEVALKDFGHQLIPKLVGDGKAGAWEHKGYWRDVGTVESYWSAHMDLIAGKGIKLDDPRWPLLTYGSQRMPAQVSAEAMVIDSLLSPGCVIRGTVRRSVIAPGVKVEAGATVEDSVILQDTCVCRGGHVAGAIVDDQVIVAEGANVGQPLADSTSIKRKHLTLIGRGTRVEPSSVVPPGDCRRA